VANAWDRDWNNNGTPKQGSSESSGNAWDRDWSNGGGSGVESVDEIWQIGEKEDDVEYGGFREGLATFIEGAVGAGDELDALYSRLSGESKTWDEAIGGSRARMKAFAEDNENLSTALDWGGMAAGFLIPGAAVAKTGTALSKAQQAKRLMTLGAAEGAVYGGLSGEGTEGRLQGVAMGVGAGAAGGYLSSRLLARNADQIAKIDAEEANRVSTGGHIWGDQGVKETVRAQKGKQAGGDFSTSAKARKVQEVKQKGDTEVEKIGFGTKLSESLDSATLGTREWLTKYGNQRAARLMTDAELMIKQSSREIDDIFDADLTRAMKVLDEIPEAKTLLANIGRAVKDPTTGKTVKVGTGVKKANGKEKKVAKRIEMGDLSRYGRTKEEAEELANLQSVYEDIIGMDLKGYAKAGKEYFPRVAKGRIMDVKNAGIDQYESPVLALKEYAKDVNAARALAVRFNIPEEDLAKIKPKKRRNGTESRVEAVIRQIEKKSRKELAPKGSSDAAKEAAVNATNNLGVALRASLVYSKQGGDAAGSVLRKVISTGLLANYSNAMLNVVEGVTLPLYQSGVKSWVGTVVPGIKATVKRKAAADDPNWISTHEFGLDRQFMGEVQAEATQGVGKLVDDVGGFFYKWSGVQTVNEMGQEMATNTAFRKGVALARDGSQQALKELGELPGMRGLSPQEVLETASALKRGDAQNQMVRLFAGNTLADVQPVLASAMPKAFNERPDGRIFYSMLSYMNRQYNRIRSDVGLNLIEAQRQGLNTQAGKAALKKASVNSTKYIALMGMANGVWDDFRKSVFNADDRDDLFGDGEIRGAEINNIEEMVSYFTETTANQLISNASSGIANIRSKEFGGSSVNVMPAPIQAATRLGSGLMDLAIKPENKADEILRFGQSYVPGISQADKVTRTLTGNRLFEELGILD